MKKKKEKKNINIKLIAAIAVLVIAVVLIIIFAVKAVKSDKNGKNDISNYVFEVISDEKVVSKLNVEYKKNKLNDITVTFIYDDSDIAAEIASVFIEDGTYVDIKAEGNKVIMHYNENDIAALSNMTKKEMIASFERQGYVYKK